LSALPRGLILVEDSVPGFAGGWITVRDAVKKALPKDAPHPGKFRTADSAAVVVAEENKEG
jgi:large subunit ribosomal protein L3